MAWSHEAGVAGVRILSSPLYISLETTAEEQSRQVSFMKYPFDARSSLPRLGTGWYSDTTHAGMPVDGKSRLEPSS